MSDEPTFVQCPQTALDWRIFSEEFEKREGFAPSFRDTRAKELFQYFTIGAHKEFIGKLNPQPPTPGRSEP